MPAPNAALPEDEPAFALLDAYLEGVQAGQKPDRVQLLADYPELAPLLDHIEGLDLLAQSAAGGKSGPPGPPTEVYAPGGDFGRFELIAEIGRGGMGVIWKARQKDLDRLVAIKMILANHLATPDEVQRFAAEARIMARLQHPHVVRIFETGEVHGQHYFVMEYIQGHSLARELAREPSAEQSARWVATVARAVGYLHQQGIIHRDLKPSNILLDETGKPFVTDFGLVKMLGTNSRVTTTGAVVGTPSYMAPEQASGRPERVGPHSDVYGLGAILYELLTGRPPFRGETALDTLVNVMEGEPTRPRLLRPAVPHPLELICLKCLEKEPDRRYASAEALAEDLDRYVNGEEVQARPAGPVAFLRRWSRRQPALVSRLAVLGAIVLVSQINSVVFANIRPEIHQKALAILFAWMAFAGGCQYFLTRDQWVQGVRKVWAVGDVLFLTALLRLTNSEISPLLIGYPFLIAAAGLWFHVHLVWFTTAACEVSYGVLMLLAANDRGVAAYPQNHVIFMVGLLGLGFMVAYQVQRMRVLNRYYEERRAG